jgi:hypothetical protein
MWSESALRNDGAQQYTHDSIVRYSVDRNDGSCEVTEVDLAHALLTRSIFRRIAGVAEPHHSTDSHSIRQTSLRGVIPDISNWVAGICRIEGGPDACPKPRVSICSATESFRNHDEP